MSHGPVSNSTTRLTLSELCNLVFNDAEAGGVDTLYCPDSKGNVQDMTKHHTHFTLTMPGSMLQPVKVLFLHLSTQTPMAVISHNLNLNHYIEFGNILALI
jgi:hypothetical protein